MLKTLRNAWKTEEIRRRILFTLLIILIYRIGNSVPVPYVDTNLLQNYFTQYYEGTVLGLYNTMSGGSFSSATIFALSIQPYINASIIIQLLCIAIPALERLTKEGGEEGKRKIERITRYTTVGIGLLQGFGYYMLLKNNSMLEAEGVWQAIVIVMSFTAGSALLMWLGEQINEFGIGNGISIILFVSIVSRFPTQIITGVSNMISGTLPWWQFTLVILGALAIILLIVIVTNAERRVPIQYSKRVVGRKMYGGQNTTLPMKVNMSGVLPIIFASTIASLPATIASFVSNTETGFWAWLLKAFDTSGATYMVIYFLLILMFSYFYSTIQFNPIEIANNLKKNGGFIPGFRAGRPTSDFLQKILTKITLFGALYLGVIAIVPLIFSSVTDLSGIGIGGTSIIIVVGVALETVKDLESRLLMRNYKGFLE